MKKNRNILAKKVGWFTFLSRKQCRV